MPVEANVSTLEARLARLEHQNKNLKLGGLALGAFALAGLGMSFAAPAPSPICDTVTAERFRLVDTSGRERALLDSYGRNETIFKLNQGGGKGSVTIVANDDGTSLMTFADSGGRRRSALSVDAEGTPELAFYDAKGEVIRQSRGVKAEGDYLEKNSR